MSNDPPNLAPAQPDELPSAETWSAMAVALDPIEPAPTLRTNLVACLQGAERFTPFAGDVARVFGVSYDAARAALLRIDNAEHWQDGGAPGSRVLTTLELHEASTVIARLPAASRIGAHAHQGREVTLVLQGRLIEDGHTTYGPGDVLDMPTDTRHAIAVSDDADCLVVFSPLRL